jgi:UDP-N-acetylglucosamine--N-acetylmuramyl-(pentapeptide) pyrophosphoryl-undecaprenol N-acetylglucosamine transferase
MSSLQRVLIMAGGTGGHVFPGLALADYLRQQGIEVHWLGTHQGLESRLVPQAGIPLHIISIGGVRGKSVLTLLKAPFRILLAIYQALRILLRLKPNVVIGMGGFASGPGGIASWILRCPLMIHEQNAKAGLTNQWLRKFSKKVLTGFPDVFGQHVKISTVGNPVRAEIVSLTPPEQRLSARHGQLRLLVLGGSLGAQAINEIVPQALAQENLSNKIEVYHQAGDKHYEAAIQAYKQAGVKADKLVPFISDMRQAYDWADIVLCRAGALTIAELCAVGLGSILVPFPHAVDDHQTANAEFLVANGAAILVPQRDLTKEKLVMLLNDLLTNPDKRMQMAKAAYELRQINVTEKIYQFCQEIA